MTTNFRNNNSLSRWLPRSKFTHLDEEILKRGGFIAGLVNDGNTCFMNSVLQSLASSKELMEFLDNNVIKTYEEMEQNEHNKEESEHEPEQGEYNNKKNSNRSGKVYGKHKKKLNRKLSSKEEERENQEPDITFSTALRDLLAALNDKYYRDKPYFKTNSLLKSMSKSPRKNILLGYDQEDAQEFFQNILAELESNVKSLNTEKLDSTPIAKSNLPEDALVGQQNLGEVGTVYIPTEQIDPNSILHDKSIQNLTPFRLMTPLDGITAERIGCLQCGENGGIRYSVFSGLSLNLPNENIGSTLKLSQLLSDWSKPEIIEGVECNRCALTAAHSHLMEQLDQFQKKPEGSIPEKLMNAVKDRVQQIQEVLAKPVIDDEDYKKLHTANMVRKCSKSKQILISRPPPLLSIHINRSVFDPRTYMIRKNNSKVLFKSRLNLAPWCCDIDEINLDARLPMSKKEKTVQQDSSEDENIGGEYYTKLHERFEQEFEDSEEERDYNDGEENYTSHYSHSKNNNNYDPLNGEADDLTSDDEDEHIEETDALGNTIRKRITENTNDENDYVKDDEKELHNIDSVNIDEPKVNVEDQLETSSDEEDVIPAPPINYTRSFSTVPATPLTYSLRSVIVHYGTHNYGHYIAFRKYRGCWWRISDETVYVVDEAEVLSTPGVFMLFYEYDYDEETGQMKDDLELIPSNNKEEEEEEEEEEGGGGGGKEARRLNSPRKRSCKKKIGVNDSDAFVQPSPKRRGRKPKDPSKPRQMLLISSCRANNTPVIRKFTKKNVARAKKKYTPFSKRFKSIAAIPDLTSLPEFYGNSLELMASSFENKLKTTQKHQILETIFSKVKKQLNSSYVKEEILKSANFQDYLPARENEFASIYLSAYSAIESDSATTIYVAGTPGVGKTLTVREVVKELLSSSTQQEIPDFLYVEINGLKMVKPTDCYETLWNKISGERLTWAASMESLEFYFKRVPKNKKKTIVVLLDELDAMVTKSQDIMYNFFNWTTYENAKLIVIAVANTMDLPERQLGNKVTSRIGFTRIMFTGYTHEELKNIIDLRLKGLNDSFFFVDTKTGNAVLMDAAGSEATEEQTLSGGVRKVCLRMSADAIEIASRKVASVSGDARRALKVCKRAAEIAEKHYMAKHGYGYDGKIVIEDESEDGMYEDEDKDLIESRKAKEEEDDSDEVQTVHITHVMKALNETLNSHAITFMTRLSFTAKLFIYALLNLMKKNGAQEQELGDIVDEIKLLIEVNGSNKFVMEITKTLFQQGSDNISEQLRIISWDFVLNQLLDAGILFKQTMKNDRICCVKLNISVEEAKRAMNEDETLKSL